MTTPVQSWRQWSPADKQPLVDVSRDYSGNPVDEIKTALKEQWASANEGASIRDPELTGAATAISNGKGVWMEDNGTIMAED